MTIRFSIALAALLLFGSDVEALDRIRIAVSNPNMPNLTVSVAQKKGFFKDENIGATPDVGARMMLKQIGLDPEKEIKVLALGSDAARMMALKQRVVDLIVISPPADSQMEKQGYRILARAYELFNFPYLGLGTQLRKIKEKPDEIRRAIKATIRANRFVRDNRDEAVQTLVDWGKVERDYAYASYDALRNLFNADGSVPEDGLRLVFDQARRTAKITRDVTPAEVADLTMLREAQLVLGIKGR